jgi:flagellar L-ring protein FlgH
MKRILCVLTLIVGMRDGLAAQGATPADSAAPVVAAPRSRGWTSDRRPVRVGDLLTVVVDEQTSASERITTRANNDRKQGGSVDFEGAPTVLNSVGIGYGARSDQTGRLDRSGDLASMLTVRVTAIEAGGTLRIEGGKLVEVDGRKQEVRLAGLVRPEDVTAGNAVLSTRIADATISYKGKAISPKTGIFGKILGLLWP